MSIFIIGNKNSKRKIILVGMIIGNKNSEKDYLSWNYLRFALRELSKGKYLEPFCIKCTWYKFCGCRNDRHFVTERSETGCGAASAGPHGRSPVDDVSYSKIYLYIKKRKKLYAQSCTMKKKTTLHAII